MMNRNTYRVLVEKPEGINHFEDPSADRRISNYITTE